MSTTKLAAQGGRHGGLPGRVGGLLHHCTNPCHRWGQEHYVSSIEIERRAPLDVFFFMKNEINLSAKQNVKGFFLTPAKLRWLNSMTLSNKKL